MKTFLLSNIHRKLAKTSNVTGTIFNKFSRPQLITLKHLSSKEKFACSDSVNLCSVVVV